MGNMPSYFIRVSVIVLLLVMSAIVWWPNSNECQCLSVSFLDVGQGDAAYIKTPDGYDMLIDGGVDTTVLRELGRVMNFTDRDIDMMVATHPDLDHIGGLLDVLERYQVHSMLTTTNINETPVSAAFKESILNEGSTVIEAEAGQVILLGEHVYIQVLSPRGDETNWETNNASIVTRIVYGDTALLLSGDASKEIEDFLVEQFGTQLKSDVLKLGHHGSKTSTGEKWLDVVQPFYAVVSAGLDNRYGHPHQEVMSRVLARGIESNSTAIDGMVTFYSDGKTVWKK